MYRKLMQSSTLGCLLPATDNFQYICGVWLKPFYLQNILVIPHSISIKTAIISHFLNGTFQGKNTSFLGWSAILAVCQESYMQLFRLHWLVILFSEKMSAAARHCKLESRSGINEQEKFLQFVATLNVQQNFVPIIRNPTNVVSQGIMTEKKTPVSRIPFT